MSTDVDVLHHNGEQLFSPRGFCKLFLFCCFDPEQTEDEITPENRARNLASINAALDFAEQSGFAGRGRLVDEIKLGEHGNHEVTRKLLDEMLEIVDPVDFLRAAGIELSGDAPTNKTMH